MVDCHAASAISADDPSQFVQPGNWVVLEVTDGKRVLGCMRPGATARIAKRKRKIFSLVGARWGDFYTVDGQDRVAPVDESGMLSAGTEEGGAIDSRANGRDNRDVADRSANQALDQEDIEVLKRRGVKGRELASNIALGSRTFKTKTALAQDKYMKKKLQKYDMRIRLVRPTALSLCETYFSKNPEKVMSLRTDALAMILGYSGVRAGVRALVYETCNGLLSSSMAERMGGYGKLFNVFTEANPTGIELLRMMNVSEAVHKTVVPVPVELFGSIHEVEADDDDWIRYSKDDEVVPNTDFVAGASRKSALSLRPRRGELKRMLREQVDVLAIATRYDVIPVVDSLIRHLAPGGSFAVYSQYLHTLSELQLALQLSKMAVRIELIEAQLVSHQVLPGRTHPLMSDSATGGFVLWGVRIVCEDLNARVVPPRTKPPKIEEDLLEGASIIADIK